MGSTNTFPSPGEPVQATLQIALTTDSTSSSATTTSTLVRGSKSMVYFMPEDC